MGCIEDISTHACILLEYPVVRIICCIEVRVDVEGSWDGFIGEIAYGFLPEEDLTVESAYVQLPTLSVLRMCYQVVRNAAAIVDGFIVISAFHPALRRLRMEVIHRSSD